MRRLLSGLVGSVLVLLASCPASAATVTRIAVAGSGLYGFYSDGAVDGSGAALPGTYREVGVMAGDYLQVGEGDWAGWGTGYFTKGAACAWLTQTEVYDSGDGLTTVQVLWVRGCAPFTTLETTAGLRTAHVVATVPATDCWAADSSGIDCGAYVGATFSIDLTAMAATDALYHDNWGHRMGGEPSVGQSLFNVTGLYRETTDLAGSITLAGQPGVTPTVRHAAMFKLSAGTVDITN